MLVAQMQADWMTQHDIKIQHKCNVYRVRTTDAEAADRLVEAIRSRWDHLKTTSVNRHYLSVNMESVDLRIGGNLVLLKMIASPIRDGPHQTDTANSYAIYVRGDTVHLIQSKRHMPEVETAEQWQARITQIAENIAMQ